MDITLDMTGGGSRSRNGDGRDASDSDEAMLGASKDDGGGDNDGDGDGGDDDDDDDDDGDNTRVQDESIIDLEEELDEDTLRIMVSTDNRLGLNETDPVRGLDSFAAFEEVLYLAKHQYRADLVLLAGDLFHHNKPSRRTLYKTMQLLRRCCMGPDPVRVQVLNSDCTNDVMADVQASLADHDQDDPDGIDDIDDDNGHDSNDGAGTNRSGRKGRKRKGQQGRRGRSNGRAAFAPSRADADRPRRQPAMRNLVVNYLDSNYGVDLPIFTIHGNHDNLTRDGGTDFLAALDVLAVSNLVNYFGRQDQVTQVSVSPTLLQKGGTHVALYGMGSLRDERLNRMWQANHVRFLRPDTGQDGREEGIWWLNIFALHQVRRDNVAIQGVSRCGGGGSGGGVLTENVVCMRPIADDVFSLGCRVARMIVCMLHLLDESAEPEPRPWHEEVHPRVHAARMVRSGRLRT